MPKGKAKAGTSTDEWDSILGTVGSISEPRVLGRIIIAATKRLVAVQDRPRSGTRSGSPSSSPGKGSGASKKDGGSKSGKKPKLSKAAFKRAASAKSAESTPSTKSPKRSTQKKKIQRLRKKINGTFKFKGEEMPALTGKELDDAKERIRILRAEMARSDNEATADQRSGPVDEESGGPTTDGSGPSMSDASRTEQTKLPSGPKGKGETVGDTAAATSGTRSDDPALTSSGRGKEPSGSRASGVSEAAAASQPTRVPAESTPLSLEQRSQLRDRDRAAASGVKVEAQNVNRRDGSNAGLEVSDPVGDKPTAERLRGGVSPRSSRKEDRRLRNRMALHATRTKIIYQALVPSDKYERKGHGKEEVRAYAWLQDAIGEDDFADLRYRNEHSRAMAKEMSVRIQKSFQYRSEGARTRGLRKVGEILEDWVTHTYSTLARTDQVVEDNLNSGVGWSMGLSRYVLHYIGTRDAVKVIGDLLESNETVTELIHRGATLTEIDRMFAYMYEVACTMTSIAPVSGDDECLVHTRTGYVF